MIGTAVAGIAAPPDRILSRIDDRQLVELKTPVPRFATAQNDAGALSPEKRIYGMRLVLKPSAAQQTDLNQLLEAQQDRKSPDFHRWLTPEQYASRFGASRGDVGRITAWLKSQGFSVDYVARGGDYITFSGSAEQVANAFHTELHSYTTNGKTLYANSTPVSVPAALAGVVSDIRGLNDYRLRPRIRKVDPRLIVARQQVVGQADFATIYDVTPLYTAGFTGAGQKIVVVGQSDILASDIDNFRTYNNLGPANLTQVLVPSSPDPGLSTGDELESDLDVEWSGGVAEGATIVFVYSTDVGTSTQYAVDNALGTVLTTSYGICENVELVTLDSDRATYQKANVEGITVMAAAGDSGAVDCDGDLNPEGSPPMAEAGLAVDAPASYPEVTAMGGTQFLPGVGYWGGGKALKYNPETVWNDTRVEDQFAATGGGASVYFTQPPWQNGFAPADGMRHVPDLAFNSSNFFDPMFVYSSDSGSGGTGPGAIGGTSCAAPTMAGVVALLNQYLLSKNTIKQAGLGNINPMLYNLAQTNYATAFHDITTGTNAVSCAPLSPGCVNGSEGWAAGIGYDSSTGLGSVDVNNLAQAWSGAAPTHSAVVPTIAGGSPVYETGANSWTFTLTLNEEAGFATKLTGITINGTDYSSQIASLFGTAAIAANGSISAKITLQNLNVSSGPASVAFSFSGTDTGGAAWNNTMTMAFTGPFTPLSATSMSNAASYGSLFAPGMLVGVYGAGMGNLVEQATALPLPQFMGGFQAYVAYGPGFGNSANASLSYVSPNQVNVQIPYEVPDGPAQMQLTNGTLLGIVTLNFTVQDTAPGIFSYSASGSGASSPIGGASASVGNSVSIYITGAGALNPAVGDGEGATPGTTSAPVAAVSLTVGGVPVAAPSFIGAVSWEAGVVQITFTIPSGVGKGPQPVVVTVGSTKSLPANINIQ